MKNSIMTGWFLSVMFSFTGFLAGMEQQIPYLGSIIPSCEYKIIIQNNFFNLVIMNQDELVESKNGIFRLKNSRKNEDLNLMPQVTFQNKDQQTTLRAMNNSFFL